MSLLTEIINGTAPPRIQQIPQNFMDYKGFLLFGKDRVRMVCPWCCNPAKILLFVDVFELEFHMKLQHEEKIISSSTSLVLTVLYYSQFGNSVVRVSRSAYENGKDFVAFMKRNQHLLLPNDPVTCTEDNCRTLCVGLNSHWRSLSSE